MSINARTTLLVSLSRRLRLWSSAVLLAIGVAAAGVTQAGPDVPFNASFSGTVTLTGPTTAVLQGSGYGSMLGRTSYAGDVANITPTPGGGITDTLTETLIGANGDTITILCLQVADPVNPGVFIGTDNWVVVGGTGRFAGARGQGTGSTNVDLNAGTFSKILKGVVSTPN